MLHSITPQQKAESRPTRAHSGTRTQTRWTKAMSREYIHVCACEAFGPRQSSFSFHLADSLDKVLVWPPGMGERCLWSEYAAKQKYGINEYHGSDVFQDQLSRSLSLWRS
nr:hypothetical protein CFP56_24483 [Quercus suber]